MTSPGKLLQSKWLWLIIGLGLAVLLYTFNPMETALSPQCTFKLLTGLNCPGCGFQRAAHAALHGHFIEAARYNFFLIYALPYLFILILTEWVWKGRRRERWRRIFESGTAIKFYIISFFVWWIVRNIFHW